MLGFEVELLPILFCIQYLGHEGKHSDAISNHSIPLLHGMHLHLVYTTSDCPLCNQEAVTEAVKQITIEFAIPPPYDSLASPIYIAFIHRPPSATEQIIVPPRAIYEVDCCSTTDKKLFKCSRCAKVQYCSKKCQTNHWAIHKAKCTSTANSSTKLPAASKQKCSTCGKENLKLSRCPCHSVAYCDSKCQEMDWLKHKTVCSANIHI